MRSLRGFSTRTAGTMVGSNGTHWKDPEVQSRLYTELMRRFRRVSEACADERHRHGAAIPSALHAELASIEISLQNYSEAIEIAHQKGHFLVSKALQKREIGPNWYCDLPMALIGTTGLLTQWEYRFNLRTHRATKQQSQTFFIPRW